MSDLPTNRRFCTTHNSMGMLKDACERVMANMDRGGATNLGEQFDGGPQPCVFVMVDVVGIGSDDE